MAGRVKVNPESGEIKVRVDPDGTYENREQVIFASLVVLARDYAEKYDDHVLEVLAEFLDDAPVVTAV